MGVIIFLIVTIAGVYWLVKFFQSLSNDMPASMTRRRTIAIDVPLAQAGTPVIKPINEVKTPEKPQRTIPERLPQIILPPPPIERLDRAIQVSPNFTTTQSSVEESLLLRTLAQMMSILSIIGVDVVGGTHYSLAAIPLTTLGAAWSWHRRHHARHWLNLSVSIVSLCIVFVLLTNISVKDLQGALGQVAPAVKMSASMSLVLGLILVALQMGLCFHLYTRKILGYSLLASGLLVAVTGSLSQNLSFLILLVGFTAIAIPALMLDYRSRIELQPVGIGIAIDRTQLPPQHLPWKYLTQLAAISICLGLILSIFLPNFHLPELSFKPTGLDRLQNLAQKYQPSPPPSSSSSSSPFSQVNAQEMAAKLLGQAGNNHYPDTIKQENLQIPPEIASQLQQFTQSILATSPQPLNSDFDRATYLAEYLKQHYQSDPQSSNPANRPPVDAKLVEQFIAKCAAAPKTCQLTGNKQDQPTFYTTMLRSIGIPARLKTGNKIDEIDPNTKMYPRPPEGTQSQTEVYFPNWGWFGLDSTPDRPLLNLDPTQLAQLQQQLQALMLSAPSTNPNTPPSPTNPNTPPSPTSPTTSPKSVNSPSPQPSTQPFEPPKWEPDPVILRIIIVAIVLCVGIAWYLLSQQQQQQQVKNLPPVEQIYRSMLANLSKQGISKRSTQTQREYADDVTRISHPQIAKVVREISELYIAWRYGKQKVNISQLSKKMQYLDHLQQLSDQKKRRERLEKWGWGK